MKIFLSAIVILLIAVFVMYGTLSPCGMFKKEIANQAQKDGDKAMYMLFGGLVDRGIDTLNPIQCLMGAFEAKTQGADKALNNFLK